MEMRENLDKRLSYKQREEPMKKILIVDDSPTIHKIFMMVLRKFNYEFDFAKDGKEGLEKIEKNPPDILFLDANMPEVNGWEVLSKVKKDYHNIYVIFMTAEEDITTPYAPDKILQKPFQMNDILRILGELGDA